MAKFNASVEFNHSNSYTVEADNEQEAKDKVQYLAIEAINDELGSHQDYIVSLEAVAETTNESEDGQDAQ